MTNLKQNVVDLPPSSRPGLFSLCSGTGMLDAAVELAWDHVFGIRPRVLGYAEREAFAASILLARMEEKSLEPAPVFCGDFRDLDARPLRDELSILAAGLPCQPYSSAGKQGGLKDARSWGTGDGPLPHALRIIEESEPAVVCLENVPQWVTGGAFRKFGEALCALGYEIEDPLFIRASDVGASHRRERVFILAYLPGKRGGLLLSARSRRERQGAPNIEWSDTRMENASMQYGTKHGCSTPEFGWTGEGMAHTHVKGFRRERRAGLCDAAPKGEGMAHARCQHRIGQSDQQESPRYATGIRSEGEHRAQQCSGVVANAGGERRPGRCELCGESEETQCTALGPSTPQFHHSLFAPGPESGDWARILDNAPWLAPALKPGFRMLADGVALALDASRPDQLRCGGNGVVVGQAAAGFVHLFKRMTATPAS